MRSRRFYISNEGGILTRLAASAPASPSLSPNVAQIKTTARGGPFLKAVSA